MTDPQTCKEQIRAILLAADELSQLIVGRNVPIAFDTRKTAPLGYVPILKEKTGGRTVYLNANLLEEQPEHLLDYYRALLVHELGHILLHLKDSGRDYRRLRRLIRAKISLVPDFFSVFNILLDEQLERVLRDTKPEWQRWFNRLDFYTRRTPQWDFQKLLLQNGCPDPDRYIAELAERGLVKVYPDSRHPFLVIQSAAIFSEVPGFTRLYAFYAVLRNRLPLSTVRETWLKECLARIPKNFKLLDVFEIHALAVVIYKIMLGREANIPFVRLKIKRKKGQGYSEIELPGSWQPGCIGEADKSHDLWRWRRVRRSRSSGGSDGDSDSAIPATNQSNAPLSNPEGDPPTPPRPPARPPRKSAKRKKRSHRTSFGGGGGVYAPASGGCGLPAWGLQTIADAKRAAKARRKENAQKRAARRRAALGIKPKKPRSTYVPRPMRRSPPPPNPSSNEVGSAAPPSSPPPPTRYHGASRETIREANKLIQEIRAEMAGERPRTPLVDHLVAETGQPSDEKNTTDIREFPDPEQVLRLVPNRRINAPLIQSIKPFVRILRPFFAVMEPEKLLQERLTGGRRLLASGLKNHLAYGETRLFADLRLTETELHRDVFVAVLLDTSASMKTDGRLERAKRVAALLGECLRECSQVEAVFLGYNQNVYLCGNHDEHSLGSLEPAGKTNEAAALDYLKKNHLQTPRRRKVVMVLSDGLPTICSVDSVRWLVRSLEKELGVQCLHAALSSEVHPAYRRRIDLVADIDLRFLRIFGKMIDGLLR